MGGGGGVDTYSTHYTDYVLQIKTKDYGYTSIPN